MSSPSRDLPAGLLYQIQTAGEIFVADAAAAAQRSVPPLLKAAASAHRELSLGAPDRKSVV